MSIQQHEAEHQLRLAGIEPASALGPYPVDMSSFLMLPQDMPDAANQPYQGSVTANDPTALARYALAHGNRYIVSRDEQDYKVFLAQAQWLVEHEVRMRNDAGGWPIPHLQPQRCTKGPWLSASAQGLAISVLLRAYQKTQEEVYLEVATRAVRTFEQDILDGGVCAPIGVDGIFFEDVAVYPASHRLCGFVFALFGLYDYVALIGDTQIEKLIARSLTTMHRVINEFDAGFWTYTDLLNRQLASPAHLSLQSMLLEALARHSGCDHCSALAAHWKSYEQRSGPRLRYLITSRITSLRNEFLNRLRTRLFPKSVESLTHVCVPLPEFPITGGVLTVVEGMSQIMQDKWQIEYLAQQVGPNEKGYVIHRFGTSKTDSWFFPVVWLYTVAGFCKLFSLMRHGADYHVVLPQDGVFTGAFAGLVAKLAGARVVCVDHSTLTTINSTVNHAERLKFLATKTWPRYLLHRLLLVCYWPSLSLLAAISARFTDHYLIPGVAGDGVEKVLGMFGVGESRITRFASMIDVDHHLFLDDDSRTGLREKKGIPGDAIVVAIICRLSPEKGLDIALKAIEQVLSAFPDLRARLHVIIAGDGPLQKQLEEEISQYGLSATCVLWGNISAEDVISLLAMSNILLYTSTRGACFPMAVLEAMASGCAVIASTQPESNALLLADGRGIAIPPNDVAQTAKALGQLVNDIELCRQMGQLARSYIGAQHSPTSFRRTLTRVTYWSELYELLDAEKRVETTVESRCEQ
jgi:glycosyltransferase involved in cell wall biosynthesis